MPPWTYRIFEPDEKKGIVCVRMLVSSLPSQGSATESWKPWSKCPGARATSRRSVAQPFLGWTNCSGRRLNASADNGAGWRITGRDRVARRALSGPRARSPASSISRPPAVAAGSIRARRSAPLRR